MTPRLALANIPVGLLGLLGLLAPAAALAEPAPSPAPPAAPVAAPAPAPAAAPAAPAPIRPPSFELLDRGDAVEVIARNVKAARTAILPVRSRLQIALAGAPTARRVVPGDTTVKLIELDTADATRMLSVKLGFDAADVKALSRFAQAIQVGNDLHVLVPRKLPPDGIARLPDPTLPPELAAAVAEIDAKPAQILGPQLESTRPREALAGAAAPRAPTQPLPGATGAPATTDDTNRATAPAPTTGTSGRIAGAHPAPTDGHAPRPDGKALPQALAPADDGWSKISMYAALGLAIAGAGIWLLRRRRTSLPPPATIDVIAQRSLGGKARIVWLSAGPREMIIAVTPQQVRMLGLWRKADASAALPGAYTHSDARPAIRELDERAADADPPRPTDRPLSPAVTGILRLRGRTGQMAAVSDEAAPGDVVADELWAKEILAATGARR